MSGLRRAVRKQKDEPGCYASLQVLSVTMIVVSQRRDTIGPCDTQSEPSSQPTSLDSFTFLPVEELSHHDT